MDKRGGGGHAIFAIVANRGEIAIPRITPPRLISAIYDLTYKALGIYGISAISRQPFHAPTRTPRFLYSYLCEERCVSEREREGEIFLDRQSACTRFRSESWRFGDQEVYIVGITRYREVCATIFP